MIAIIGISRRRHTSNPLRDALILDHEFDERSGAAPGLPLRFLIPVIVGGILLGHALRELQEIGEGNELRDRRRFVPRCIVSANNDRAGCRQGRLRWIVLREQEALHQPPVFDPHPAVGAACTPSIICRRTWYFAGTISLARSMAR